MSLLEIIYEFIYRYSGVGKEKVINAEKMAIEEVQKLRVKYHEQSDEQKKEKNFSNFYFQWEKHPIVITGTLFFYSLFNQSMTWKETDKLTNKEDI